MKKNLFIIFTIFLSLSAQVDKETNNQRDNKSLLFDDKGVTKQQVESIISTCKKMNLIINVLMIIL